jgi:hypothetical protein
MKKLFKWIFKDELHRLESTIVDLNVVIQKYSDAEKRVKNLLGNIDISVDVHQYSRSWACISIQGQESDYIKFMDLGKREAREIAQFLRHYDRDANIKIDAAPTVSKFMKFDIYNR